MPISIKSFLLRAAVIWLLVTMWAVSIIAAYAMPAGQLFQKPVWTLGNSSSLDCVYLRNLCAQNGRGVGPVAAFVSITRAGVEWVPDVGGQLHQFAANVLALGVGIGLNAWQATTDELLWSRDLTQTAWTKVNVTAAHTATGADGSTNVASLLTASAANGTALQALSITSEAQCFSAYVQRVTGSGEIDMTLNGGTSYTAITSQINSAGYTRVPSTGCVEATLANPVVGFRIVTNGDAINVDFAQIEDNTFPTPACPSTGTACSRAADVITVTTPTVTTPPAFGSTLYAGGTPAALTMYGIGQAIFGLSNGTSTFASRLLRASSGGTADLQVRNSGNSTIGSVAVWGQNTFAKVAGAFAPTQSLVFNGAGAVTQTASLASGLNEIDIGDTPGLGQYFNGTISRVALWPTVMQPSSFLQQITSGNGP